MLTMIPCPRCKVRLQTPDKLLGKVIHCPKCKKAMRLVERRNGTVPAAPPKPVPALEGTESTPEIDDFISRLEQVDSVDGIGEASHTPLGPPPGASDDVDIEKMMEDAAGQGDAHEEIIQEEGAHKEPAQGLAGHEMLEEELVEEAPIDEEVLDEEAVEPAHQEAVEEAPVDEPLLDEVVDEAGAKAGREELTDAEDMEVVDEAEEEAGKLSKVVEKFLGANLFLIKGQSGIFSFNSAWDFLHPDTKNKIGSAVERPEGIMQALRFFLRRNWLPSKIEIREEKTNELVFIVRRPAYFFNCTLSVHDADNKLLAKFTYKPLLRMLGKPMPVERKGGVKFGTCEFYFLKGRVDLMDDKKKELANMQTESAYTKAIKIYWAPRGGSYYITFNKPLYDNPHDKMIFLGVTLAMDLLQEDSKASAGKGGISFGS
jgi:hypothetical protein